MICEMGTLIGSKGPAKAERVSGCLEAEDDRIATDVGQEGQRWHRGCYAGKVQGGC